MESEADRVAEHIVGMNYKHSKTKFGNKNKGKETINRKCSKCEEEDNDDKEKPIQISRKSSQKINRIWKFQMKQTMKIKKVISDGGKPLDTPLKEFMETKFGFDFSRVRIHTDDHAVDSAEALNAEAYSIGYDIVFGRGLYAPWTSLGRRILAHELTHIIQQSAEPSKNMNTYLTHRSDLTSSDNLLSYTKKNRLLTFRSSVMHNDTLYRQHKKSPPKKATTSVTKEYTSLIKNVELQIMNKPNMSIFVNEAAYEMYVSLINPLTAVGTADVIGGPDCDKFVFGFIQFVGPFVIEVFNLRNRKTNTDLYFDKGTPISSHLPVLDGT